MMQTMQPNAAHPQNVKPKGKKTALFVFLCVAAFLVAFLGSALFKITYTPRALAAYSVQWSDQIGTAHTDFSYGAREANKFDLYLPANQSGQAYGLVVYLHAGGFTSGDKADDAAMLQWLCSKGYVAAGINYTLRDAAHPEASVYSQSMEIKAAMPVVVEQAEKLGYPIDKMAISGGSAGHCLAMLYAYRDAAAAPVPVKMVFGAVGPSSFYPEDWGCYGLDQNTPESRAAAAGLFGVMAGKELSADLFGTPAYDATVKDISALLWVDDNTVPSLMAYGQYDKVQGFPASLRLDEALTAHNIPHDYIVMEHSGHGLQNDTAKYVEYMEKLEAYLATYMGEGADAGAAA